MEKGPYLKHPLSITEQLALLEQRGLAIDDETKAEKYLRRIGYFRLSAYFYPLLSEPKSDHVYKKGASFSDALNMYRFDRRLRLLVILSNRENRDRRACFHRACRSGCHEERFMAFG